MVKNLAQFLDKSQEKFIIQALELEFGSLNFSSASSDNHSCDGTFKGTHQYLSSEYILVYDNDAIAVCKTQWHLHYRGFILSPSASSLAGFLAKLRLTGDHLLFALFDVLSYLRESHTVASVNLAHHIFNPLFCRTSFTLQTLQVPFL